MTNNKKQTAMQMAIAHYKKLSEEGSNQAYVVAKFLEETFLEMEKEQKANTWNNAINAVEKDKWESFEQYYEQTYGGGEQ
jgi:hypothetical protein